MPSCYAFTCLIAEKISLLVFNSLVQHYNVHYVTHCVARLRSEEESYSCSQEVYDDGIILPHQTRQVSAH